MYIGGSWQTCDDGFVRPVIRGEVLASDASWVPADFLLDIAADRTVLSADILARINLPHITPTNPIAGVGGMAASVDVVTQIRLTDSDAGKVLFRGQYAAATQLETLDMSVLGRDLINLFAAIVDRTGDVVCLLRDRHRYVIYHS